MVDTRARNSSCGAATCSVVIFWVVWLEFPRAGATPARYLCPPDPSPHLFVAIPLEEGCKEEQHLVGGKHGIQAGPGKVGDMWGRNLETRIIPPLGRARVGIATDFPSTHPHMAYPPPLCSPLPTHLLRPM